MISTRPLLHPHYRTHSSLLQSVLFCIPLLLLEISRNPSLVQSFLVLPVHRTYHPLGPTVQSNAVARELHAMTKKSGASQLRETTMEEFTFQNVLITGASSGLGRSLALLLAQQCGVSNLILSARSVAALEQVAADCRIGRPNLQVHIIPADLADPQSVQQLAAQALAIVPVIHVLVNNGGVSSRSRFVDTDIAVDAKLMQINFLAGAALAKAVVQRQLQQPCDRTTRAPRGRIIWISSVQGKLGIPHRSSYAASKFAVQGYCECLRAELYSDGILVHCVSPGYIATNLSRAAVTGSGALHGQLDATTAQGQDPGVVAATILNRVVAGDLDFTVAAGVSARIAIALRFLCPRLLQRQLRQRYLKTEAKEKRE
jgi:dehydrogenase/reductase SDR family member 7B